MDVKVFSSGAMGQEKLEQQASFSALLAVSCVFKTPYWNNFLRNPEEDNFICSEIYSQDCTWPSCWCLYSFYCLEWHWQLNLYHASRLCCIGRFTWPVYAPFTFWSSSWQRFLNRICCRMNVSYYFTGFKRLFPDRNVQTILTDSWSDVPVYFYSFHY